MDMITSGGLRMPKLGLGTWQMSGAQCVQAVQSALGKGYRHIDTAEMYNNEEAVGEALAAGPVPREEIHITSKVWHEHLAPDAMRRAIETSLRKLRTDYVDLYLIHWPSPSMDLPKAIETLVSLKEAGQARQIGVSNFTVALMRRAVEEVGAPIVCNQVEYHLFLDQSKVLDYARAHGIAVTAYCPLARGKLDEHPEIAGIARKHGASPQQVALKWLLDQDAVSAIPKAAREASQQANWDAQTLMLDDADRAVIAHLAKTERIVNPAFAPAWDRPAADLAA
jgi:2,5-diketo-D-gluconate reductase B